MNKLSKNYSVAGAVVTIKLVTSASQIKIEIEVDCRPLDQALPDHSSHQLLHYLDLSNYSRRDSCWWAKTYRTITVQTGSQARRAIKTNLDRIDDGVNAALLARATRMMEIEGILP